MCHWVFYIYEKGPALIMKATVVVSCYKQDKYIAECLDSILNQDTDFDFDLLVSDDFSQDSTPDILRSYCDRFPGKIKLVLRSENVGAAKNYIDAHNKAAGEIVFHFDGDDVMLPGKLQKQYDIFRDHPEVNIVFHRARYFSDDGTCVTETGSPISMKGSKFFDRKDLALWGSIAVHSSYAYRRKSRATRELNREFMEWFFAMDSLNSGGKGFYIDEVLVKYRCNQNGSTYLSTRSGRVKAYNIYFQDIFHYFKVVHSVKRELYANCLFTMIAMYVAGCGISSQALLFAVNNFYNFRPVLLFNVFRMRSSVAPEKRIR